MNTKLKKRGSACQLYASKPIVRHEIGEDMDELIVLNLCQYFIEMQNVFKKSLHLHFILLNYEV